MSHRRPTFSTLSLLSVLLITTPACTRVVAPQRGVTAYAPTSGAPAAPASARPVPERTTVLGHSRQGRPIELISFGDGPEVVLVFGAIHGNEPESARLTTALLAELRRTPESCAGRTVAVIPVANPDGLAAGTRYNAAGVDLNRNFPARNWRRGKRYGTQPASEPETQALLAAIARLQPVRIVAVHSISGQRRCVNYDGPAADLAAHLAAANHYPVAATIGYPTPGSFGSWAGAEQQIAVITLELPRGGAAEKLWQENRPALQAFVAGSPTADRAIGE